MSETATKSRPHKKKFSESRRRNKQPKRGGPAVLLTCETGRESKCKREGLEILRHYYYQCKDGDKSEEKEKNLGLDEEIALLNSGATAEQVLQKVPSKKSSPFAVYDTGCRGSVFVMCTLPNCSIIPPIRKEAGDSETLAGTKRGVGQEPDAGVSSKKVRLEDQEQPASEANVDKKNLAENNLSGTDSAARTSQNNQVDAPTKNDDTAKDLPWDPLQTVRRVISDINECSNAAPSSRFVTRMIPVQATCFASSEEIRHAARALISQMLGSLPTSTTHTYAAAVKIRNCSNVTKKQVIDIIVELVTEQLDSLCWKVDLDDPQYTIHVEICKTLCGVAVIPDCKSFRNFNLVQIREERTPLESSD